MSKPTFLSVLKKHGFKRTKSYAEDVVPYQLGDDPKSMIYAEIYKCHCDYIWIVGKGVKDKSKYNPGQHFWEPEKLDTLLTELLKRKTNERKD